LQKIFPGWPLLPSVRNGINWPVMSPLTLQLPADLKASLVRAARQSRKSPAPFAREALAESLKVTPPDRTNGASLHDLSRDLCGATRGRPHDLARNKRRLIEPT